MPLPEFISGAGWLEILELYGYSRDVGADIDDAYLWCVGKNPGPPFGMYFAASEYAAVEVALVEEFLVEANGFDEDELRACIETVCTRRGWADTR